MSIQSFGIIILSKSYLFYAQFFYKRSLFKNQVMLNYRLAARVNDLQYSVEAGLRRHIFLSIKLLNFKVAFDEICLIQWIWLSSMDGMDDLYSMVSSPLFRQQLTLEMFIFSFIFCFQTKSLLYFCLRSTAALEFMFSFRGLNPDTCSCSILMFSFRGSNADTYSCSIFKFSLPFFGQLQFSQSTNFMTFSFLFSNNTGTRLFYVLISSEF